MSAPRKRNLFTNLAPLLAASLLASAQAHAEAPGVVRTDLPSRSGPEAAHDETHVTLSAGLSSSFVDDRLTQSRLLGFNVGAEFTHPINENFRGNVDAFFDLFTGQSSSLLPDEDKPGQYFSVREANLEWLPSDRFAARAGMVDPSKIAPAVLIRAAGFPGVSERLVALPGPTSFTLSAMQALPTSENITVPTNPDNVTPFLLLERAALRSSQRGFFEEWELAATHFYFSEQNTMTAQKSRFRGNTVEGIGENGARFSYLYSGGGLSASTKLRLAPRYRLVLDGSLHANFDAPSDRNRAWDAGIAMDIAVASAARVSPELRVFRVESDATVAAYANPAYSYANRQGWLAQVRVALPKSNLSLTSGYMRANSLRPDLYTDDRSQFVFTLESRHEIL